jgi:hypothetical protein
MPKRNSPSGTTTALAACLLGLQACALAPSSERAAGNAVDVLAKRLVGEYSNHAQVWEAERSDASVPGRYKVSIVPAAAGEAHGRMLRFRQSRLGGGASPQRDARFLLEPGPDGGVIQRVERRAGDGWQPLPGCTVYWRRAESGFEGETRGNECRFRDPRSGEVVTRHRRWSARGDELVWQERRVTSRGEETETLRFVAVGWYSGWAGVRGRNDDGRGKGEWRIERRLRLHDGGGTRKLPAVSGTAHRIRLERLRWPKSGIRMLRLSVIEAASGDLVAYAWAPPDAAYIGIHLGWIQVGLEVANAAPPDAMAGQR